MGVHNRPILHKIATKKPMSVSGNNQIIAEILPKLVANLDDQKTALASLAAQQVETATALKSVAEDVKAVSEAHLSLAKEVSDSHKAPYNLMLTAVGLVFVCIGGATWYLSDNISKSEDLTNARIAAVVENTDQRLDTRARERQREFDKHEDLMARTTERLDDRIRKLEQRTYTLYKEGKPY